MKLLFYVSAPITKIETFMERELVHISNEKFH